MYRADVGKAIDELIKLRNSSWNVAGLVSWGGTFLSFLGTVSPITALAGTAVALAFGITDALSSSYLQKQQDDYTLIYLEMTRVTNPVIYIEVVQRYKYIENNKGKGWLLDGNPTVARYYSDY